MLRTEAIRNLKTGWIEKGADHAPNQGGQIFLFLHGCPDTPSIWDPQIEYFSKKHLVLAPYLRGIGPSEAPTKSDRDRRYSLDSVALDHLEILRKYDPEGMRKVVIVGHDIGAPYAWNLASVLGPRAEALIILNGASVLQMAKRFRNPHQVAKSWYIGVFQVPKVPEMILNHWGGRMLRRAWKSGGMPESNRLADAGGIRSFLPHYRTLMKSVPKQVIHPPERLKAPLLVMAGRDDAFLEPPTVDEIKGLATNFTIRVLEGNHWIQREKPEKVNGLVEDFLKKETAWQRG